MLFGLPVTGRLIGRLVRGLVRGGHSSYRGALELLREVLGIGRPTPGDCGCENWATTAGSPQRPSRTAVADGRAGQEWACPGLACRGDVFHAVRTAVAALADHTVRASSVVENIHRHLRNDFFLRRHLGRESLDLLRCDRNHHRFPRSERPERVGHSPHEMLTGQPPPHGLDQQTHPPLHAA